MENIYLEILPRDKNYGKESHGAPLFLKQTHKGKNVIHWVQLHDSTWNSHKTTNNFWAWETLSEPEWHDLPHILEIIHISGLLMFKDQKIKWKTTEKY